MSMYYVICDHTHTVLLTTDSLSRAMEVGLEHGFAWVYTKTSTGYKPVPSPMESIMSWDDMPYPIGK